ncbi:aminodeoxychorismate synthase component I [Exilibacterium tricleocarpae]|uniref:aminodeoxychorismate synthase n=1 Tax=Exilibacterium tricleocarpae TaxID=2591008 RepID=A0A545T8K8_9GAMM|nr:aminodeoxychorismate synthase component I [Exilibacterium tricleocarpae]TQV73525.1 aminodeoxychorismate synthase component I [Exilibacterium tricleocarpae]
MTQLSVTDIDYRPDSRPLFEAVADLPQAVWLDSGRPRSRFGRYDIIAAAPETLLTTRGLCTEVTTASGKHSARDNPFALVQAHLEPLHTSVAKDLPFCGGALGYFGYDLGRRLERLPSLAAADIDLPDMQIGIYNWALVQDHQQRHAWLLCLPDCAPTHRRDILQRVSKKDTKNVNNFFKIKNLKSNFDVSSYKEKLAKIDAYIHAGDCYQVNFAQRFSADFEGSPYAAYRRLRQVLPSPYSAFMDLGDQAVLCLSPERFIHLAGQQVETRPIKGTLPRGASAAADRANAQRLQASAKDRAENLMIVDLLRNDLGKSCLPGSVRVPELFRLESFPNVHHLVSTVTGTLSSDRSPLALLQHCFPGGSITGAPKLRAMQIIEELEPCRRSIYCGSIGYISANGNMDTNIAIRTLACDGDRIHCWGGGGIVADSEPDLEYAESLAKIQVLLDGLSA